MGRNSIRGVAGLDTVEGAKKGAAGAATTGSGTGPFICDLKDRGTYSKGRTVGKSLPVIFSFIRNMARANSSRVSCPAFVISASSLSVSIE